MPTQAISHAHNTKKPLLACGTIAGPLFTIAWIAESATRTDYNFLQHPISSLSIGESGWMQSATFIVTGLLLLAFAFGLRRVLQSRHAPAWGPMLVGVVGIGLLGAGIFVTDPLNGYPPGTPNLPLQYSVVGRLHRLFSALVFLGLPSACFVFARIFRRAGEHAWANYSVITSVAFVAMFIITSVGFAQVAGLAKYAGLLQRITLTIGWAWLTLLAIHMLQALPETPTRRK